MAGDVYDAIVIGAGVNGLAAAGTLARAGRRALVLERSDVIGGSYAAFEFAPGFRAAPLGLDGGWLPPAVARGLALGSIPPDAEGANRAMRGGASGGRKGGAPDSSAVFLHDQPALSVAVEPGRFLGVPSGPDSAGAIASFSARDTEAWPGFVERMRSMTGFLESLYQQPAPDLDASGAGELLNLGRLALRLRGLGRAGMTDLLRTVPMSVAELVDDTFESDALKAAIASVGVRGIRQGPRSRGTAFTLLHNLIGAGTTPSPAWAGRFPPGGPETLAAAFESAARREGVMIRTNAPVARILVRDYAVAGVVLEDGEEIAGRAVLSSADATRTLLGMVDPVWLDPEFVHAVRNIRYRGCTSFVLYALDGMPDVPGLAQPGAALAGIVSLTPTMEALERAYDATKYGEVAERPHIEVCAPSLRAEGLAPDGRFVVLARVHYTVHRAEAKADGEAGDRGGMAEAEDVSAPLADRVTDAIACVSPGFADRMLHRVELSPGDIEEQYGYTEGAMSQGEMALDQIVFMRPVAGWSRYAMPIDGLYLCGAGTHPGPGVVGGPGWLAANEVLRAGSGR